MIKADLFRRIGMVQMKPKKRSRNSPRLPYVVYRLIINRKKVNVYLPGSLRKKEYYLQERISMKSYLEQDPNYKYPLPNATTVLVLGIISIPTCFCFGVVGMACGIIALSLAKRDMERYYDTPESYTYGSFSNLQAGKICAIIGVCLFGLFMMLMALSQFDKS